MVMQRLTVMLLALAVCRRRSRASARDRARHVGHRRRDRAGRRSGPGSEPRPAGFHALDAADQPAVAAHKMAFRLTHRFGRDARRRATSAIWSGDLFGLDSGAQIGLEFRYGLIRGGQIGIYRTSDRTIQFFGQYELHVAEDLSRSASTSSPTSTAPTTSRTVIHPGSPRCSRARSASARRFYLQPAWINNTNPEPAELVDDNDTFLIGVGARVRVHGRHLPRVRGVASRRWFQARRHACQLRHRAAGRRPRLPAEFLERLRDDAGPGRARRRRRRLVSWLQPFRGSSSDDRSSIMHEVFVFPAIAAALVVAVTAVACGGGSSTPTTPTPPTSTTPPTTDDGRRRRPIRRRSRSAPMAASARQA